MTTPLALSPLEIMRRHPCFSEEAHDLVGRVHLPVAPRCNIQCAFCQRRVCTTLTAQHPGWTRQILTPPEALDLVRQLASSFPDEAFVVGVAGPGEPLENEETFQALEAIHAEFPALTKCVSSNGLLLADKLTQLLGVGVKALTVTINAPDGQVGEDIYTWVRYRGTIHRGRAAAQLLIDRQMRGVQAALDAGLAVKVNTVLIPGVNDRHVSRLARRLSEMGVQLMNIMPLIPEGRMRSRRPPTSRELEAARTECQPMVAQFRQCAQCRADIICFPAHGGEISLA
jgi:nitrogen fixation protein NifB